jgi:hypothetical protein
VGTLTSLGVSGNLTVDTTTLFVDAANNAVGVGTTNPITYGKFAIEDTVNADLRAYVRNNDTGSSAKASIAINAAGNSWRMSMGSSANNSNALTWDVDVGSPQTRMTLTTSGNLGIGTASPSVALDVAGSGNLTSRARFEKTGTGKILQFGADRDTSAVPYIGSESNHDFAFITNNAERARIDASGNLGLGVTPSAWRVSDRALQIGSTMVLTADTNVTADVGYNYFFNASNVQTYITSAPASYYRQYLGVHSWHTAPSGTAGNAISFTQPMTLSATGELQVGSTTFGGWGNTGRLKIKQGTTTAYDGVLVTSSTNENGVFIGHTGSVAQIGTENGTGGSSTPIAFMAAAAERLRIKTTGQLRFVPLSADPAGAETGDVYYNSSTNKLRVYNGAWVDLH